jgi:DNA-binding IclR family transcriptional regulator
MSTARSKSPTRPRRAGQPRGVQSVEIGARLLKALCQRDRPTSLSRLAEDAGLSPGKAYQYFASLGASKISAQDPETGLYDLGPLAVEIGLSALGRIDGVAIVTSRLESLADSVRLDTYVTVWSPQGPMVLRWIKGATDVAIRIREGTILPLLITATGRTWIYHLPVSATESIIESEIAEMHGRTTLSPSRLRENYLNKIKEASDGLTYEEGERKIGVSAVAAPIFDSHGLAFVVTILSSHGKSDFLREGGAVATLREFARSTTRRLGGETNTKI